MFFAAAMPQQVCVKVTQIANPGGIYQKFDLDLCDAQGKVYMLLQHFTTLAAPKADGGSVDARAKHATDKKVTDDAAENCSISDQTGLR